MWTSADDNRERYVKTLEVLIQKRARSLANDSDISRRIDGEFVNCAHILLDELIEEARSSSQIKA